MNFKQLGLSAPILKALETQGYATPTPIQVGAIPPALIGRDVLGLAQTGTGKTCAFATPILQRLAAAPQKGPRVIRALILTPTRELALQIQESFEAYGAGLPLKSAVIFGGVGQQPQVDKIRAGLDILVATPGRLLDLHGQGLLDLSHIQIFVLDEADRMLDMGFIHDVRRVLKLLPEKKQTLFFSATMPPEVQGLVNALLHDYARVAVTPVSSPVEVIQQSLYYVDRGNKTKLLAHLLHKPGVKNALIFSRTKHGANRVAGDLCKAGITAAAIHGNKSQTARQQALSDFKAGKLKALVATDIAARGIDIEELSHVFNYNLPDVPETYVHRIGRTGRAGHGGTAISFCDISEKEELKAIEKLLGKPIPVVEDHPFPMQDFQPPKRDKNGKIINAEDQEARQAARDRKAQRRAEAASQPRQTPKPKAAPAPQPPKPVPAQKLKPAPDRRTPKEKRAAPGYKPSRTLDEALHAVSPQDSASQPERDAAFEAWMEEERRIQAQQGYHDPLGGEEIMDATARLLAPKRPVTPPVPKPPQPQKKGRGRVADRPVQPKPAPQIKAQPPGKKAQEPAQHREPQPAPTKKAPVKARGTSPQLPAKAKGASPQAPAKAKGTSPQAPAKAKGTSPQAPAKGRGTSPQDLEARKAKIREAAKARRARPEPQRPRTHGEMDSTEHHSLMKPYYLSDDD